MDVKAMNRCRQSQACLHMCLQRAITENNMEMMGNLMDMGADPNCFLLSSVQEGKEEVVKFLIDKGANTCKRDHTSTSTDALSLAISTGNLNMVELLLDNGAEFTKNSSLLTAIEKRSLEIVRLLIQRGASVNFSGKNGMTPLIKCFEAAEPDFIIVDELIKNGANLDMVTEQGSPLLKSIDRGNFEVVKELIQKGADVNIPDKYENYPIINAVTKRRYELLKLLCDKGAKVNAVDKNGKNALIEAVRQENFAVVKYLVNKNIDVNQKYHNNYYKTTALEMALKNFDFRTFDFLLNSGADPTLASGTIKEMIRSEPDFAVYYTAKLKERKASNC